MRIGILGGTFDPVHIGHAALAKAAIEELKLDRLLLIPSGDPPYKKPCTAKIHRLAMVRFAAEDIAGAEVSDIEIDRPGPTYAADTLMQLHDMYPDAELIYILGSDAARKVRNWKRSDEVMKLCSFACVARAGSGEDVPEGMLRLSADIPGISSDDIRSRIAVGDDVSALLPEKVAGYIEAFALYITGMPEHEVYADLKSRLKPGRLAHTMGVAKTCVELARIHGASPARAYIAGLVHDCAKYMTPQQLLELADGSGADDDEKQLMPVLHAPVGAYIARTRYGIRDEAILRAIRRHTVGAEDMGLLDAILYVADMAEPGRKSFPGLKKARELAYQDIFKAAAFCGKLTRKFNQGKGSSLHPNTEKMIRNIDAEV